MLAIAIITTSTIAMLNVEWNWEALAGVTLSR